MRDEDELRSHVGIISEPTSCNVSDTLYDSGALEKFLGGDPEQTIGPDVRRNKGVLSTWDIGISCKLYSFDASSVNTLLILRCLSKMLLSTCTMVGFLQGRNTIFQVVCSLKLGLVFVT